MSSVDVQRPVQRSGKALVLFSDGTGNSSAKLQKTNVWRLYRAVDVTPQPGSPRQVVLYDDGIGTSGFKLIALLAGVFGVGLRRNVLDLYCFLCRHYEPGDRIYVFGFSRGAFTVRIVIGFICSTGLVRVHDEHGREIVTDGELNLLASDAYRRFRRWFQVSGFTNGLVTLLRDLRDVMIRRRRAKKGLPILRDEHLLGLKKNDIAFVGVWDTVAAYGAPVAEITRGIDRWIWPLSVPNYLSPMVACARHALALDDERDTFHPKLWDEVREQTLVCSTDPEERVSPDRLRQVWFAGMHSDVGGGYADDALAYVSLVWMADEAQRAGLRLYKEEVDKFRRIADPLGPMHDSRSGVASYYRYQPRLISTHLDAKRRYPLRRILQDPERHGRGLLRQVHVHASVLERIKVGTLGYAPVVLPNKYVVEDGAPIELCPRLRARAQELVWDDVWRRRVGYFATLAATFALALLPLVPREPALACYGPQCAVAPLLYLATRLLPDFVDPWLNAFVAHQGPFLMLASTIITLLMWTHRVEIRLRDRMRRLFEFSMFGRSGDIGELRRQALRRSITRAVRSNRAYQCVLHFLKWHGGPALAAIAISTAALLLSAASLLLVVGSAHRVHMTFEEALGRHCPEDAQNVQGDFSINELCWRTAVTVEKSKRYRVRMSVKDGATWSDRALMTDGAISASPEGLSSAQSDWWVRYPAVLLRRSMSDAWFQPLVRIEGHRSLWGTVTSLPMKRASLDRPEYIGEFTAPATGPLVLSVNDAILLWGSDRRVFYADNTGMATISVELVR